jgi:hypothetical protein
MKAKQFSDAMSEIDNKYVDEALNYKKKGNMPVWAKWGTMAACFAVVAILGIGVFRSGLFGGTTDTVTLENGDEIVFVKLDSVDDSLSDIAVNVTTRQLTEEEIATIFPDLPVTANAIFQKDNMDTGASQQLIGFEGHVGNVKIVISTSDVQLLDTVIDGTEETSEINGTSITAGYSVTDANSQGDQYVIYYATFEIGDCKIYLENAGTKDNSETTKNQLAAVIQKLIKNGELNLASFMDSEIGTGLDGNPEEYNPLPDSQTTGEEVTGQDPAGN